MTLICLPCGYKYGLRFFIARDAQKRMIDDARSTAESTTVEIIDNDFEDIAAMTLIRNNIYIM